MLEEIRLNVTLKIGLGRRVTILDGTGSRREGDGQASSMTKIRMYYISERQRSAKRTSVGRTVA